MYSDEAISYKKSKSGFEANNKKFELWIFELHILRLFNSEHSSSIHIHPSKHENSSRIAQSLSLSINLSEILI